MSFFVYVKSFGSYLQFSISQLVIVLRPIKQML